MVIIRLLGLASGLPSPDEGKFLRSYDLDARGGIGEAWATADPTKAMTFVSAAHAFAAWKETSTVKPVRDDGQPNRPLTAWTIEVLPLEDA